jgi:hypothetical protein
VTKVVTHEPSVIESPAMKSLRTVRGLDIEEVARLARRAQPFAIETLDKLRLDFTEGDRAHWDTLYDVGAFTKLHELGILLHWATVTDVGPAFAGWKWLLEGKLGERLTRLSVDFYSSRPAVADWLGAFASPALDTLALSDNVRMVRIRRTGAQFAITYKFREGRPNLGRMAWTLGEIAMTFDGFPIAAAPRLDIVLTRKVTRADLAKLRAVFAAGLARQFSEVVVSQA